jgi:hypothetical protein
LSKGEEQERWTPSDESTSPTGSSPTSYKCLVANDDSGDENDDEEEHDDRKDESTSSQGTFPRIASTNNDVREKETDDLCEEEIRKFYTNLSKEDKMLLMKLLTRNKEQGETLLRLGKTLIKTNNNLEKMTKEHEELRCSHDDLVQRYDSVLTEQRNNDDALSCVARLKIENAILKRQVELLNHDKLALTKKYDMLSYYHDNLLDKHIMLDVVIASINSCEPNFCTCAHLDNISPCANPYCSKESQFFNEHQDAGSKEKLLINKERNNKAKQLRRRRIAQPPQDIHGRMVKKLEMGETATSVKLHKKDVPKAINEAINMNKEKGKDSISHVVCTNHLSMSSKSKKGREKMRCFKCRN